MFSPLVLETKKAEVDLLIHATEDADKVIKAVKKALGVSKDAEVMKLYGHYGNPILKVKFVLKKEEADELLRKVLKKLGEEDRDAMLWDLDVSVDDSGWFFLRLDKQKLVEGRIKIGKSDAVRMKFFIGGGKEKAKEYVRRFL